MSIKLMSQVWENGPQNRTQAFVLLALADHSNDEGMSWPSIKRIAAKSRLTTERGAQKVLRQLEADGWIEITTGGGRHGCNTYQINPERLFTPNHGSPLNGGSPPPRTEVHKTPNGGSPEPLEPSIEPSPVTFLDFWEDWPNQVSEASAKKEWEKLTDLEKLECAENAAAWFHRWEIRNPSLTPINPITFLRDKRWQDGQKISALTVKIEPAVVAANAINSGKEFLCRHVTASSARAAIEAGKVTLEQCQKVGVL